MDDGGPTATVKDFVKKVFHGIAKAFGIQTDGDVTEKEIISMVNEGHEQGVLQASEAEMITNIFELDDKEAHDIMTHRKNIVAIDGNMSLQEALDFMIGESYSRYPVYDGDIDHIIGILHFKDAVRVRETSKSAVISEKKVKSIKGLMREARFIPETRNIDVLFHNMRSMKIQMVIVIDEYGQTAGLVAMEDILEEIVGNIMDEYDEEEAHIEEKSENEYIIEGLTPLEELEERFGISFEEEDFETLNGFLISKMDKIPDDDEQFETDVGGYHFKVLSVKNKMIENVLVTKLPETEKEHDRT
ncbi:MAG: HlyC/CorC family transporter [Lachnospiraceae bacterium]|nr:HlyC/CorC family transporter [Lachnospiraceae bacterium]